MDFVSVLFTLNHSCLFLDNESDGPPEVRFLSWRLPFTSSRDLLAVARSMRECHLLIGLSGMLEKGLTRELHNAAIHSI